MSGRPDREVILERDVEIIRGGTTLNADRATYRVVEDEVEAQGNVRMRRFGDTYTGDELRFKMEAQEGYVTNPTYRLQLNNAQGNAERIDFLGENQAEVSQGTYSTCEGPDPDWYLKAGRLSLDGDRDEGLARSALLYFKDVPILAAPAMSFPLSEARKSGVLPPTIGVTSKGGFELMVPYYFNIAPNRDLTLFPRLFSRRGVQLGAEGRYLGETFSGTTRLEYLPGDREAGRDRYAVSSTHSHALAPGLGLTWNLNHASDNEYPDDFTSTITKSRERLLPRDVALSYGQSFWSVVARASNYQLLQDVRAPIARPYDRLPQITFASGQQDVAGGFDWNADSEFTRFYHPDQVRGDRYMLNPRIAYPIIEPGYFVTPKVGVHYTTYSLTNTAPGARDSLDRTLPTFSLDSGMVFERDTSFLGTPMIQTLEPRLFYVYTPYRDQSAFPVFDSAEADLSFAQLFSENRFIGYDRISDANQVTAALVSRYIEQNGMERLRFAVGQRYYFNDQRVSFRGVSDNSRSDLLLLAFGRITQQISIDGNLQYSQSNNSVSHANYGAQWAPEPKKVLNLRYRRDRINDLEQVDVSGQWPLARRWYGVARVNYSLPDSKVAEGLFGVEYMADCWVWRVVGQRTPTSSGRANSSIFFQLELNGLTKLGSNPLDALRLNIPGYHLVNQPSNP